MRIKRPKLEADNLPSTIWVSTRSYAFTPTDKHNSTNTTIIIIIIIIIKVLFSRQTGRNVDETGGYLYLKLLSESSELG
jgi:hypothetical protein